MGYGNGKIPGLIVLALAALLPASVFGDDDIAVLSEGVRGAGLKMPVYDTDRLEFILTSEEVEKKGDLIDATKPIIELIRPDADLDKVTYMEQLEGYPLNSKQEAVVTFWTDRSFSDAIISAETAEIDQPSQTAAGAGKVFVRSPILDLNGIGFVADYQQRTVPVRHAVDMVIRYSVRDGADLATQAARAAAEGRPRLDTLLVTADSMLVDMLHNEITLEGHVKMLEARINFLVCDRMVISLADKEPPSEASAGVEKSASASEASAEPDDLEQAGSLSELGENVGANKRLTRIVCTGNVELSEPRADIFTGKMTVLFREKPNAGGAAETDSPTGNTEIDQIFCDDGVKIVTRQLETEEEKSAEPVKTADAAGDEAGTEKPAALTALNNPLEALASSGEMKKGMLTADRGQINLPANVAEFHGNVFVTDFASTELHGDDLYLYGRDLDPSEVLPTLPPDERLPTRIALSEDKEVVRIVLENNVTIDNVDVKNGHQTAGGSLAVYEVADRTVTLTDSVTGRAYIDDHTKKKYTTGSKLIYDLETGEAHGLKVRMQGYTSR